MEALRRAVGAGESDDPAGAVLAGLAPDGRVVVVVDQFEELFTNCDDEIGRSEFVDALVRLADDPERRAKVVTALRADFYGRYAVYPELAELLATGHVLVGPMQADEFRRAIELPAQRAGLRVEPTLVDALLADVVDEPGALPLLSTALLELWTRRRGRTLTLDAYEQSGGVRGAVARMAEEAFAGLPPQQQPVARAVLLRLASEEEGRTIAPRRAPLTEFDVNDAAVADVIASLTARRLLTVDEGSLEVAHDALLREWPRLAGWLDEDAQGRTLRRHLTTAANEWDAAGRDPGELYRGARLASALDWTAEHDVELNALEREFLAASRATSEAEAQRIRRTNRRLRIFLAAAVGALAIAVLAGGYAVVQQREAERAAAAEQEQRIEAEKQRAEAEAQKAEAEAAAREADAHRVAAQALTEDSLDRSLLLAREAVALDDSPDSWSALLAAAERAPAAIRVLRGSQDPIEWVDMTPDGSILIAQDNTGQARFWRTETNELLWGVQLYAGLFSHDISPDGKTLATMTFEVEPDLYLMGIDPDSPSAIPVPIGLPDALGPLLFTSDGTSLITLERDDAHPGRQRLVFRDVATARETGRAIPVAGGDGTALLASVGADSVAYSFRPDEGTAGFTQVIDLDDGHVELEVPYSGPVATSPDGHSLAIGREDGTLVVVDLATGTMRAAIGGHLGTVTGLAFTPDGRGMVSTGLDRDAIVWDTGTLVVREILRGHTGPVFGPVISPDGRTAWTGSYDATVIAWDLAGDRRLVRPFSLGSASGPGLHIATVVGDGTLVYSLPGGRVRLHDLAGARSDRDITVWDQASVAAVDTTVSGDGSAPTGELFNLAAQPGGTLVAITSDLPVPVLLDIASDEVRRLDGGHTDAFTGAVAFSADGGRLATSGGDGRVIIWDIEGRTHVALPPWTNGWASALAFDPSGSLLAVGLSEDSNDRGQVDVWDIANQRLAARLQVDLYDVWSAEFTDDGKWLIATGWQSGDVTVWDTSTWEQATAISAHAGGALDAIVDPAARFIVSAGDDGVARLWDLASGRAMGTPLVVRQGVLSEALVAVSLADDGGSVVAVNDQGDGAVWPLDEAVWAEHTCAVAGRTLTDQELEAYLPGQAAPQGCTE